MMQPRFIVIEGIDGSGKTTQTKCVADHLRTLGQSVEVTTEPTSSTIGSVVRKLVLLDDCVSEWTALYLFAADRCDHLDMMVKPALMKGKTVLCDRYVLSTLAYQATSDNGPTLEEAWRIHSHFRAPDLTVFVDIPVAIALKRLRHRAEVAHERYENQRRLQAIDAGYHDAMGLLRRFGHRFVVVDGVGSKEEVTERILVAIASGE
jgi:dTMP kinase